MGYFRVLLSAAALFISCSTAAAEERIPAAEAVKKIEAGAVIIDVRSAEEFGAGHISGALNIPHDQMEARLAEIAAYKEKDVVVYCRSGRRSELALDVLKNAGFKSAYNAGGLADLQSAGAKVAR